MHLVKESLFGFMPWDFFFQNWWPVQLGSFEGFLHSHKFWLHDSVVDYPDPSYSVSLCDRMSTRFRKLDWNLIFILISGGREACMLWCVCKVFVYLQNMFGTVRRIHGHRMPPSISCINPLCKVCSVPWASISHKRWSPRCSPPVTLLQNIDHFGYETPLVTWGSLIFSETPIYIWIYSHNIQVHVCIYIYTLYIIYWR